MAGPVLPDRALANRASPQQLSSFVPHPLARVPISRGGIWRAPNSGPRLLPDHSLPRLLHYKLVGFGVPIETSTSNGGGPRKERRRRPCSSLPSPCTQPASHPSSRRMATGYNGVSTKSVSLEDIKNETVDLVRYFSDSFNFFFAFPVAMTSLLHLVDLLASSSLPFRRRFP